MANRGWLASVGNGALGEARIRALLLNRFWVSTRSVDVNGADFLVELPSDRRFTDLLSPSVGTVQAKFCKDDATSHYIPMDYVVDENGVPLEGFFVIVTVGHEDEEQSYVLTSKEVSNLPEGKGKSRGKFYLSSDAWNATSPRTSREILDVIETTLKRRNDQQTERFLKSINIPDFEFTRTGLDPEWLLPIPNEHAFISDAVYRTRSGVRPDIYSFDNIMDAMQRVMTSRDASVVVQGLEDVAKDPHVIISEDGDNYLHHRLIANYEMEHRELRSAVLAHRTRLEYLRKNGFLAKFLQVSESIRGEHENFFEAHKDLRLLANGEPDYSVLGHFAETEVKLDPITMTIISVSTRLSSTRSHPQNGPNTLLLFRPLYLRWIEDGPASVWRELHGLQIELLSRYYTLLNPGDPVLAPKRPTHLNP